MDPGPVVQKLHATFKSGKSKSIDFRKQQLMKLKDLLDENTDVILGAMKEDLGKPAAESFLLEVQIVINEICEAINNLDDWIKPDYVPKSMINKMNTIYNIYEPLGVCLIIGAWNYPIQITLSPLASAIAAGNCALIKPSEISPNTTDLLEKLIEKYLDNDCYRVLKGGVEETTAILKCRFDHIFYTGNTVVGKIMVKAAAEHLSKVTLELGGKSPCYLGQSSNLKLASRRIAWGKFVNSGQTCIAPDYILCHPSAQEEFIQEMKNTITEFFGEDPKSSKDFGRIVNARHFKRVHKLMSSGRQAIGGNVDEEEKYISPTVLTDILSSDPVMQEEIFGPVLPIITVNDIDEAINFINEREKPLALYVFTNDDKEVERFIVDTSSGAICANDTLMYASAEHLPFGGVGHSGTGAYHGKIGFEEFSHKKPVYVTKQMLEAVNTLRYPPYNQTNVNRLVWLLGKRVKRSSSDVLFIPCLILGIFFSFVMKIIGLPRYFLS